MPIFRENQKSLLEMQATWVTSITNLLHGNVPLQVPVEMVLPLQFVNVVLMICARWETFVSTDNAQDVGSVTSFPITMEVHIDI